MQRSKKYSSNSNVNTSISNRNNRYMGGWIVLILITAMIGSYCMRDYTN